MNDSRTGRAIAMLTWLVLAATSTGQDEEPEVEEIQKDIAVMKLRAVANDQTFDQWVFRERVNPAGARRAFEANLALRIDAIDQSCTLTEAQRRKVNLAGRGDIKRFFDVYDMAKRRFDAVKNDPNWRRLVQPEVNTLQIAFRAGLFHEESFLAKSLARTLTAEQFARYDAGTRERQAFLHRANIELVIAALEASIPFTDRQRHDFIAFMLKEFRPPRRQTPNGFHVLCARLAAIPQEKIKPLFDAVQWKVVSAFLAQYRGVLQMLKQMGQWQEEEELEDPIEKLPSPEPLIF